MREKEARPVEAAETFLYVLRNPLMRIIFKLANTRCPKNKQPLIEYALDDCICEKRNTCISCEWFSRIVSLAIRNGEAAFGIKRDSLEKIIRNVYYRRGLVSVLEGIARLGVAIPFIPISPFLVVWNYTNACNLRCIHCYQRADRPLPDELSTEEKKAVIDELSEAGVVSIAFSGGEPLMAKDFLEIARYATDRDIHVAVATNGTLITNEMARKLKESGVQYAEVSLDGATSQTHNSFRGTPDAFEKTIRGVENLLHENIFTCIAATATKHTLHEIPQIIELSKELGVKRVLVFNFIPTGRGEGIVDMDLTPVEREDLLNHLYDELATGELEALCTAPQYSRVCFQRSMQKGRDLVTPTHFYAGEFHGRTRSLAEFIGGCGAGRLYCAIQPNGLVTPCVFMPIVVGDLRRESFKDVWLNSKVLHDLRDRRRLKGRCRHCEFRHVCGGCRARAYTYYDDYLAPDPGCIRELKEPSISFAKGSMVKRLPFSISSNRELVVEA